MKEIERKFLVKSDAFKNEAYKRERVVQGFLNSDPQRVVRVRLTDKEGFLTIKGKSDPSGISRFEWERTLSLAEAEALLSLCEPGIIEKIRYYVEAGAHVFEVDEFLGANLGLVVAEVELESETEFFAKPEWLGREVSGESPYYNSNLSKHPYEAW